MKRIFTASIVLTAILVLASCSRHKPTDSHTSGLAKIVCDESFANIVEQEIDVFEYTYPQASIMSYYVDETSAIDSLKSGATSLIVVSHELPDDLTKHLNNHDRRVHSLKIAVDAIAVIANNENPIEELSLAELRDILLGKVTDWNEISPNKSGKITIVFDHQGSGTVKYMKDSLTAGADFAENVLAAKTNKEVFEAVKKRKNALGIIGVTWLNSDLDGTSSDEMTIEQKVDRLQRNDTTELAAEDRNKIVKDIKVLGIRRNDNPVAYKPFQYYIYTGDYPLYRSIYAISTAPGGSLPHGFFTFLTGVISQKIILGTGILPANIPLRNVELTQ